MKSLFAVLALAVPPLVMEIKTANAASPSLFTILALAVPPLVMEIKTASASCTAKFGGETCLSKTEVGFSYLSIFPDVDR